MKRRLVALAGACALALFSVLTALAAPRKPVNVAGTWQLILAGMASRPLTLVFTQNGASLKGTMGKDAKGGTPITGTVDGDKVAFATPTPPPGGKSIVEKFSAQISGDTMTGTVEVIGKGFTGLQSFMNMDKYEPWTAKRQK